MKPLNFILPFIKRFSLLITFLVAIQNISFGQVSEEAARNQISLKQFREARETYSKLAVEFPDNISFRIWIARISAWLKELPKSIRQYDEILASNPNNREALLGKSYALMWQKKYRKAIEVIGVAEKSGRYEISLLLTKVNFFLYQNKLSEAREMLQIAKEIDPQNVEVKELDEKLRKLKTTLFQTGCDQNFEPFTATTTSCFARYTVKTGKDEVTGKAQTGKRFGKTYREIGINWRREIDAKLSFIANANIELNKKVANLDTNFSANYKLNEHLSFGVDYRFWRLNKKNINIFSVAASYSLNEKTRFDTTLYSSSNRVLLERFSRRITKQFNVSLTYVKSFENRSVFGGNLSQDALMGSGEYQISRSIHVKGSYGVTKKGNETLKKFYGFGITVSR
jgi:tetratricopeptide (TPR) repeat protein